MVKQVKLKKGVWVTIILFAAIASSVGIYYGIRNAQLQSQLDSFGNTSPTSYTISYVDKYDPANLKIDDNANEYWYKTSIAGLDNEEIKDLTWSDFSLAETGKTFTPVVDYLYVLKTNGTGIETQYRVAGLGNGTTLVFGGNLDVLPLGANVIELVNTTADVAVAAYSEVGGTTFLNTDYRDWTLVLTCLDASEAATASKTSKEGFSTYYDPENARWVSPVIRITYNTTCAASWGSLTSTYVNREAASTVYLYLEVNVDLVGQTELEFKLGSGIGTTFEVAAVDIGYGSSDDFTSWDSQT